MAEAPHDRAAGGLRRPASPMQGPAMARTPEALATAGRFSFRALVAGFEDALERNGALVRAFHCRLGGRLVRFRVVGSDLALQLAAAVDHRAASAAPGEDPEVTIDVWDQAATGVACAIVPCDQQMGPFGKVTRSPDDRYVAYQRPDSTSWLDRSTGRIVAWFRAVDSLYLDERAKPFHKLLFVWLRDRGLFLTHAGLVGRYGRGVLLSAKGGSGKSTTTVLGLMDGYDFLGDDFVGLTEASDGAFLGHGFFASSLIDTRHLARFPSLRSRAVDPYQPHERKSLLLFASLYRDRLPETMTIAAIAIPRVVETDRASLRPASKIQTLLALAPSSLFLMPMPTRSAFEIYVRLVQRYPTYVLEIGRDFASIPPCLGTLLETS